MFTFCIAILLFLNSDGYLKNNSTVKDKPPPLIHNHVYCFVLIRLLLGHVIMPRYHAENQ